MRNSLFNLIPGWPATLGSGALLALFLAGGAAPSVAQDTMAERAVTAEDSSPVRWQTDDGDIVQVGSHTLAEGETVGDIVVTGGDLRVRGEVDGDALVIGGDLILEPTGRIDGDAVVAGGEIVENGGRVTGEMRVVDDISALAGLDAARMEADDGERDRHRHELSREIEREIREARRTHRESSWFDPIREGFARIISTLALGLVLAGIGAALIFYGRPYLETVSDTIRGSTLRAGAVGLAAGFLAIPGFVVLVVALAVSIVGIPLLILAIPLYPLAIVAALAFGLLGAAHALGERTADERTLLDFGSRNSYSYLFTGLGMLLAPLLAAHLLGMTGFLEWAGTLLAFCATAVIWAAAMIGLGAVILSRAGRRRTFVTPPSDEPPGPDPLLDDDPFAPEPRV